MVSYKNIDFNTIGSDYTFSEPTCDITTNPLLTNKVQVRETGSPIPFTKEVVDFFRDQVRLAFASEDARFYDPPEFLGSPRINGELKRFIVALYSFLDPRNLPKQSLSQLMQLIGNKDAVKYLKDLRFVSLVKLGLGNGRFAQTDPALEQIKPIQITDIGQIFNYRYWIFWEEPDPQDEIWCHEPIEPIDPDHMKEYREVLFQILPDSVEQVDPREVLMSVTGSGSVPEGYPGMSSKVYIEKGVVGRNAFATDHIHAKLCYIQKCPGDSRRASVLTVPRSNTVKYIEKQCALIAEEIRYSCYVSDPEEFSKRYDYFTATFTRFLCRDIKKDGLTKPREVLRNTLDVICKKYPHLEFFSKFKNFYNEWTYYLAEEPDNIIHPPRGVGLGMSSALTTIVQSTICQMTINRMLREGELGIEGKIAGLFYHDDSAVGATLQEDLDNYDSEENQVLKDLRFIKNYKKTFEADNFVLCERYSNSLDNKRSYQLNLLNSPFIACNIVQAKDYSQQIIKYKTQFNVKEWVSAYVAYWGHEFDPTEAVLPYRLGGWIPAEYKGVDTSFLWFSLEEQRLHTALLLAASSHKLERPVKKKFRLDKTPYLSPLEQLLGSSLDCGSNSEYFHYKEPIGKVHVAMSNFNGETSLFRAYSLLKKKRIGKFRQELNNPILTSVSDLYDLYCAEFPFRDILPPPAVAESRPITDYEVDMDFDPTYLYKSVNPSMAYLAWHNPGHPALQKLIPSPIPPMFTGLFTGIKMSEKSHLSFVNQDALIGPWGHSFTRLVTIPLGSFDFSGTDWVNPYNVAAAWTAYHFTNSIPTRAPKCGVWADIASYRCSPFNKWFSTTKFRDLFIYCVDMLGWPFMAKSEYLSDEFFEHLLFELNPDYVLATRGVPKGTNPENIPLPKPDYDEIVSLGLGIEKPIALWNITGFGLEEDGGLNRGYNSGYESGSEDSDVINFDSLVAFDVREQRPDSSDDEEEVPQYEPLPVGSDYSSDDGYISCESSSSSEDSSDSKSTKEDTWDPGIQSRNLES